MCGSGVTARVHQAIARLGRARVAPRRPAARPVLPADCEVVDLTHVLSPEFPMWPGDPPFEMRAFSALTETTFFANELVLHEHSGTHIDAPAHACATGVTVEQIPAASLVAPLAIVDIAARAAADPDALLTVEDVLEWESAHGSLPAGALVVMRSGWSGRAPGPAFLNIDSSGVPVMRTPGFAPAAARFLAEQRDVVGIGTDTFSIDAGRSQDFGAHVAALGSGLYAVEALANLEAVPASGAVAVVGAPKHRGGSGGPARVLALMPR